MRRRSVVAETHQKLEVPANEAVLTTKPSSNLSSIEHTPNRKRSKSKKLSKTVKKSKNRERNDS